MPPAVEADLLPASSVLFLSTLYDVNESPYPEDKISELFVECFLNSSLWTHAIRRFAPLRVSCNLSRDGTFHLLFASVMEADKVRSFSSN